MNLGPARMGIIALNVCLIAFLWWYGLDYFFRSGISMNEPDFDYSKLGNDAGVSTGLLPYQAIWESFGHTPAATENPVRPIPRDVDELGQIGVEADALSYYAEDERLSTAHLRLKGETQGEFVRVGLKFKDSFEVVSIRPKNGDSKFMSVTLRDRRGKEIVLDFEYKFNR